VRPVDDDRQAVLAAERAQLPDREDVPGQVRDVAEVQDLRARRDGRLEAAQDLGLHTRHRE